MAIFLLFAFIAVPIAEIAVFIEVGGRIGGLNTIILVVVTALVGTWLLRSQNIFPVDEVFDGLCLLAAGAFLLTPGFVTDTVGFLLFVPPLRRLLRRGIWLWLSRSGTTRVWVNGETVTGTEPHHGQHTPPGTIEGEYHEIGTGKDRDDDEKPPLNRP
jgi:UPF0716 protein FxsA